MFPNLDAELARRGLNKGDIAKTLGVRYATVIDKTKGRSRLYFVEAIKIRDNLFPDCALEYLFEERKELQHEHSG